MSSVVVGLGKTGASCVRYLAKRGERVSATDSAARAAGPRGAGRPCEVDRTAARRLRSVAARGRIAGADVARACRSRSPSRRRRGPAASRCSGDVELFARAVRAPVIGITGTNGKSTVTTLVARMAAAAGRRVLAGGNLGEPALDLLEQPDRPTCTCWSCRASNWRPPPRWCSQAAVVLNVTADHLDRYPSVAAYAQAKSRIFAKAADRGAERRRSRG